MSSNEATSDASTDTDYTFRQTSPLSLSEYEGVDHQQRPKLTFDESTLPDDVDEATVEDLNWAVDALAGLVIVPNIVLWVRSSERSLLLAHHPHEHHERAGHLRAVSFEDRGKANPELTTETEVDAGLITAFDAINTLYDFILEGHYGAGYEILLAEHAYIDSLETVDHPVLSQTEHRLNWGRTHFSWSAIPKDRGRTAFPELTYFDVDETASEHAHAKAKLAEHTETFYAHLRD